MKSIYDKPASTAARPGRVSPAAHAVNDLPGGPAVRQLNLHTGGDPHRAWSRRWLHWFMLIACIVIFVAVFA